MEAMYVLCRPRITMIWWINLHRNDSCIAVYITGLMGSLPAVVSNPTGIYVYVYTYNYVYKIFKIPCRIGGGDSEFSERGSEY